MLRHHSCTNFNVSAASACVVAACIGRRQASSVNPKNCFTDIYRWPPLIGVRAATAGSASMNEHVHVRDEDAEKTRSNGIRALEKFELVVGFVPIGILNGAP